MRLPNSILRNHFVLLITEIFEMLSGRKAFNECWPPITDEEFMAACPPGTDRFIALKVRRIVSEQLGLEYSRLHPAMRFVEDLGC